MVTRTEFLVRLASGGWLVLMHGCGGGGDDTSAAPASPAPAPTPASTCGASLISNNHGHTLSIPAADLNSAVALSYSIGGAAGHAHQVTFSPAQLAQLKAGQPVLVSSTASQGHTHDVTGACT